MNNAEEPFTDLSRDFNQIRLLTLLQGSAEEPIEVKLHVVRLDGEEEYQTLSYVWASPKGSGSIILNGTRFTVTINLQQALKVLRSATESKRFWIDAICINQQNWEERSFQVRLMDQIYRRSKETFVWLGSPSDHTAETFKFLESLPTSRFGAPAMLSSMYEELKGRLENNSGQEWRIVRDGFWGDIAARPFWKRTWVVQEVVLSMEVTILCGSNQNQLTKLANAAWKLKDATQGAQPIFLEQFTGIDPSRMDR